MQKAKMNADRFSKSVGVFYSINWDWLITEVIAKNKIDGANKAKTVKMADGTVGAREWGKR